MPEFENLKPYEQPDAAPGQRVLPVAPHASRTGEFRPRPRQRRVATAPTLSPAPVEVRDPVEAGEMERAYRAAERAERAAERKRGIRRPGPLTRWWRQLLKWLPGGNKEPEKPQKRTRKRSAKPRPGGKQGHARPPQKASPGTKSGPPKDRSKTPRGKRPAGKSGPEKSRQPERKSKSAETRRPRPGTNGKSPPPPETVQRPEPAEAPASTASAPPSRKRRNRSRNAPRANSSSGPGRDA